MKTIYLLRHGEVEDRYKDCYRGQIDCELSPEGIAMSILNARFLLRQGVDHVVTTGMKRTAPVGEELEMHGIPHTREPGLMERDLGDWEGKNRQRVRDENTEEYEALQRRELDAMISGSNETLRMYLERLRAAWARVLAIPATKLGVVAHAGSNAHIMARVKEMPPEFGQPVGTMHELQVTEGGIVVVRENYLVEEA